MPIRKEHRFLYPIDWRELSAIICFERAKGRCEGCARPHLTHVSHLGDGRWWDEALGIWRNGNGRPLPRLAPPSRGGPPLASTYVVLATAHLDHDPGNSRPRNLKALCQRCHMLHDKDEHRRRRWHSYRRRKAIGDLFDGPYGLA
jgi:hypothetical protein